MKKILKSQNGVTLTSLVIAVAVILILTGTIIVNVTGNLKTEKLRNMQSDIENLRDKVSTYYAQYGKIPADTSIEYTNINGLQSAGVISEVADTGKFYVLDLSAMENVTLNYGKDYEKIRNKEATTEEQINSLTDLYIINEASHNIFYVDGIELDGDRYYTDYTADDIDTAYVDLRYVDNVEIPDGFYYVGGTKDTGLVISDVQGDDLDNSKGGNQFVWIPVENEADYVRNTSYADTNVSEAAYTDTGYLPEGIQPNTDGAEYNEEAEKQAVMRAKGFFVSRFEAGNDGSGNLISKKGATVYNNISQEDSKTKAKSFINNDNVKSALCSGIQWDVIMNFVNKKEDGQGNTFDVTTSNSDRHTGSLANSGQNEADKVCNIYDLEGNSIEFVAEKTSYTTSGGEQYIFLDRGGTYVFENSRPSSFRRSDDGDNDPNISFRFVLYVTPRDNWSPAYDKTTTYTDENGDTATIPQGFSVSRKQNEKTIDDGLVVKASDGSEFVWIPVETPVASSETDGTNNKAMAIKNGDNYRGLLYDFTSSGSTVMKGCTTTDSDYREPDIVSDYDNNTNYNNGLFTKESLKEDYNKMIESVNKYHGFYVGRYELGLEGTTPVSKNASKNKNITSAIASNTNTRMWYGLYSKCKEYAIEKSGNSVVSSMIWGSQYDAMLNWILKSGATVGGNSAKRNTSTITGNNISDIIKNIFDVYGCQYEWTLESNKSIYRVVRGGSANYNNELSYRSYDFPNPTITDYGGSRLTLYIK